MLTGLRRTTALALTAPLLAACGAVASISPRHSGPCTTSDQYGTCLFPPYTVSQDMWGQVSGSRQTLTARSAARWRVTTYEPPGAHIRAYPNVSENLGQPISHYTSVTATFADTMPTAGREEAAFDIWVHGAPGTASTAGMVEVMVWTDVHHEQPAGTQIATTTIDGQTFAVWGCRVSHCVGHPYYAFVLDHNESSGQVDILAALRFLTSDGLIHASDPLTQVADGWEISNTGGTTETFAMTSYQLSVVPSS